MRAREGVVVDTNTLISRLLLPASVPAQAVRRAVADAQLLAFDATLVELADRRAEASSVGKVPGSGVGRLWLLLIAAGRDHQCW